MNWEESVRWKTVIPTFRLYLLYYSYSVQGPFYYPWFSPSSKSEYIRYSVLAHFSKSNYILYIWSKFSFRHKKFTHIKIRYSSQSYCGDIERVGDEVHHIPHVTDVLPQPHVPQLLNLAPDETRDPGQDATLHQAGRRAPVYLKIWFTCKFNICYYQ